MPPDPAPQKLEESAAKVAEEASTETPVEETTEDPKPPVPNGEDKETPKAEQKTEKKTDWPDEVPRDKEGKRPSDNTIDFDKLKEYLPEEVFKSVDHRFKSLYKQTKAQDRYLDQLGQDFQNVTETIKELKDQDSNKNKNIEDLTNVVAELSTKDASAQQQIEVNALKSQLSEAYQNMEFDKVADIQVAITQLLAQPQKKIDLPELSQAKAEENQKHPQEEIQDVPGWTPREQVYIKEWMNEVDGNGQPVRPWAQQWHPLNPYALEQTKALMQHPQLQNADLDTVLSTVDNVMAAQMQQPQEQPAAETKTEEKPAAKQPPEVLTGDQNVRSAKDEDKVTLSGEQKQVARRLFSKLSAADAEKKYLTSLEKLQKMEK